jgi:hypothetical protein
MFQIKIEDLCRYFCFYQRKRKTWEVFNYLALCYPILPRLEFRNLLTLSGPAHAACSGHGNQVFFDTKNVRNLSHTYFYF